MEGPRSDPAEPTAATGRATEEIQERFLGQAVLHSSIAVLVADEHMQYVAVNDSACRMLGYERQELLGLRVTDVAIAPGASDLYAEMIQVGQAFGVAPLRKKDGSMIVFSYWAGETVVGGVLYYVSFGVPGRPRTLVEEKPPRDGGA